MPTTSEPGFECPECGIKLYDKMACKLCGWKRAKTAAASMGRLSAPEAYREPAPRPAYVEPSAAEQREIRIKLGETLDKLATAMVRPGRGILHERGQEVRPGDWPSRFASTDELDAEKLRQLQAFKAWTEERLG